MKTIFFLTFVYACNGFAMADVRLHMFLNEVRSLSELPMDKLIEIKSAFEDVQEPPANFVIGDRKSLPSSLPMALPLKRLEKKPMRRYEDYYHDEKGKGSKISKIFQLSLTALSFLAFGGYLLTLIISAIKRNAATTSTGNVIFLSNLQSMQKYKRPKRGAIFDPMENDFNTERLYRGMIMLSEGYALYN